MSTTDRSCSRENHPVTLSNGDCMSQKEFHRIYEEMAEDFRAELLGGIVFVREPLAMPHGLSHAHLVSLLVAYGASSPGVQVPADATVILGDKDEVQPDAFLRVSPEYKGQTLDTGKGPYVLGPPELVAEVSFSSRSIDLHLKRKRYMRAGVLEYLVLCLQPKVIVWLDLHRRTRLKPDGDGVFRSLVFPGLWIHGEALLSLDYTQGMAVLAQGLASAEHAAFVSRLAAERERR